MPVSKKINTDLNLCGNELQEAIIQNLASAPNNPKTGQEYFNTVNHSKYIWNGTAWVDETNIGEILTFTAPLVKNGTIVSANVDTTIGTNSNHLVTSGAVKNYIDNNTTSATSSTASGWAMPSNVYDTLTLGTSGSTYIAPANGYFYLGFISGGLSYYGLQGSIMKSGLVCQTVNHAAELFLPVKTSEVITVIYQIAPTDVDFKFIYAQGENANVQSN